ncbi:MAG: DUF4065 domain-containing protein [Thermodesulfobacteriota bacterium]|nr:DUF4065 domain-containing protein [Thermodesulfobacteriota bacterium]
MKQISATILAEFILTSYPDKNITPMKLQKLAYYAKAWTLVANRQCTDAQFERWQFGPVNREIYQKYKLYSRENIPIPVDMQTRVQGEDADFLKFILNNYVDHSAVALSAMTHKEKPWVETLPDAVIPDDVIREYYSKRSFARNFQGKAWNEGKFYVLKTNSWHSFTMDMTDEEAKAYESYASYTEYLRRTKIANQEFDKFLEKLF